MQERLNDMTGAARQRWNRFNDTGMEQIKGQVNNVVGAVQKQTGRTSRQAQKEMKKVMENYGKDNLQAMQDAGQNMLTNFRGTLNDRPWMAALIAVVVLSLFVGLVVRPMRNNY